MNMDVNLADLCDAIAGALPDRCALVCDGERRSYPELMARSNQVAQVLAQAGVTPDETVGLYLSNSVAHIEALLGCMVARAIPVNINYRYTGAELAHLFAGGQARGADRGRRARRAGRRGRLVVPVAAHGAGHRHRRGLLRPVRPGGVRGRFREGRGGRAGAAAGQRAQRRRQADHLHRRHDRAAQGRAVAARGLLLLRAGGRQPLRAAAAQRGRGPDRGGGVDRRSAT